MPALPGLLSALSALLVTLNALYMTQPASTTPITGIFNATSSAPLAPPLQPVTVPVNITPVTVAIPQAPSTAPTLTPSPLLEALLPSAPTVGHGRALTKLSGAIVNILCTSSDSAVRSVSGSGVIFDPKGLILTNSHIAQYYLLDAVMPESISCVIRTGSPAQSTYIAAPAYISSEWIKDNPNTLTTASPRGTGEHDFAVLAITGSATSAPLPSSFPYVPLSTSEPELKDDVAIGSYGAQTLTSTQIRSALYHTLAFAEIKDVYTFEGRTVDLIAMTGSIAAQIGSSGGGVTDEKGNLIGVITTSTTSGDLLSRTLRAITIDHLRRSFKEDSGENFDTYFKNGNVSSFVRVFVDDTLKMGAVLKRNIGR